jgi:hypothetical protein
MHTMLDHLNLITPEILEHFMKVILNRGLGAKSVFDIVHRYGSNFNVYFDDNDDTVAIAVLISSTHNDFLNHFNRIVIGDFHDLATINNHLSSIMMILIIRFILAIRGYKEYAEHVIWYQVHIMLVAKIGKSMTASNIFTEEELKKYPEIANIISNNPGDDETKKRYSEWLKLLIENCEHS